MGFVNIELLVFKDNLYDVFKNNKVLYKKQSNYQLKVFDIDRRREYIRKHNDELKKTVLSIKL